MAKFAIIILAAINTALAVPATAQLSSTQRIVGGEATTIEEYPYLAALLRYNLAAWSHSCGGSLLTSRTILTAAHCLFSLDTPLLWRARLGSSDKTSGGQLIEAAQLIMHKDYIHHTLANDIAIMRLAAPAILSESVQVVRIPPSVYNIPDNTQVTLVGWGRLEHQGALTDILRHVDVNIINQEICAERYLFLNNFEYWPYQVDDGMICTGILDVGGKETCTGDSGGPTTLKTSEGHVVVGITSWGYRCSEPEYPGVKVRTSHYTDWIVAYGST